MELSQRSGEILNRRGSQHKKFESQERDQFRYNMMYNKMHHLVNDGEEQKKRERGSRNLNHAAKLMITQPSEASLKTIEISRSRYGRSRDKKNAQNASGLPMINSPSNFNDSFLSKQEN